MKTLCALKIIVDAAERAREKKGSGECSPSTLDGVLGVNPVGCVCFDEISIKVHKPLHCGITFLDRFISSTITDLNWICRRYRCL